MTKRSKDPAFLFYPGDWTLGTMAFTRQQKGAYLDLLMAQFSLGPLTIDQIKNVLGSDFSAWPHLQSKFVCIEGKFHNERLAAEIANRINWVESRRKNRSSKNNETHDSSYQNTYDADMLHHMENVDEDENKDEDLNFPSAKNQKTSDDPAELFDIETEYSHNYDILLMQHGLKKEFRKEYFSKFRAKRISTGEHLTRRQMIAKFDTFLGWVKQYETKIDKPGRQSGRDRLKNELGL